MWHKSFFQIFFALALLNSISCSHYFQRPAKTPPNNSTAKLIPLEDFFKNASTIGHQLSPNGQHVAFLAPYQSRMNVFIQNLATGKKTRLTSETKRDIASYFWKGNSRILFTLDEAGDENDKLFSVTTDGKNRKSYTNFPKVRTEIIDDLPDDPVNVIVGLNKRKAEVFDAYRLNTKKGSLELIAENPGNIVNWMADHNGKLRLAISSDGVNRSLLYRDRENQQFRPILTTSFKDALSPEFFTFDNKNIYAISNLGRDKSAIVIFDLINGKEMKTLYENPDYDVTGLTFSRKDKALIAAKFTSWKREHHFFHPKFQQMFTRLQSKLPNAEINISSTDKREEKFIIRTYSDKTQGAYYLYDQKKDELALLQEISPWLDPNEMSEMRSIEYFARDGMKIHGLLTLPKGSSGKNLPIIVNPHGGPWHRNSWGFNPEVQFLANRGFGVFQMNFRGSTGYGKKFWEASFKQWGRKMQDDITDGVRWLIKEGIAHEGKIAIYGASYGGYATLAGLAFTPDLYACGIDYVGVSNLFTFMKTIPPYWQPMLDQFHEMVGNPDDEKDKIIMTATSPVFHVDKMKAPLFIAQGANDPRVNKAESDQMVEALKKRGIVVEYMLKDNEGHGFHNEENRFDFYRAMEKFLQSCMNK